MENFSLRTSKAVLLEGAPAGQLTGGQIRSWERKSGEGKEDCLRVINPQAAVFIEFCAYSIEGDLESRELGIY